MPPPPHPCLGRPVIPGPGIFDGVIIAGTGGFPYLSAHPASDSPQRFVLSPFDWTADVFPAGHKRTDAGMPGRVSVAEAGGYA